MPAILYPLPHIPTHIIQPQLIRLLLPHLVRATAAIINIPSDRINIITAAVQKFILCAGFPAPGCILPFRFGGQAVVLTRLFT